MAGSFGCATASSKASRGSSKTDPRDLEQVICDLKKVLDAASAVQSSGPTPGTDIAKIAFLSGSDSIDSDSTWKSSTASPIVTPQTSDNII